MTNKRYGRQDPTKSFVLPYTVTSGTEAIKYYKETGREPQPWQEALIYDILSVNKDGLWAHTKFGYSVPRRNGKGEILTMRELYALMKGERVLHTAHRTSTSSSASLRLVNLLKASGYKEVIRPKKDEVYTKSYIYSKQFGLERVTLIDTGGTVDFRTRTSKGGLGEGFDLLVIDEAQEYTNDQQSTLQYVVSDSDNPQTILCGTPPTVVSSGTVFMHLRDNVLSGSMEDTGWAEWSVSHQSDVNDVELWYECNPAMGYQLKERDIRSEDKEDDVDFNIQRLGLWIRYNQKSDISEQEWADLQVRRVPDLEKDVYCGVKFGHDGKNACLGVSVKTKNGKRFLEVVDCQPVRSGNEWIVKYLNALKPKSVIIDGANGQSNLEKELKDARIKTKIVLPTVKQVISANAAFETALEGNAICHMGQPSLAQAAANCEKRAIGSNGGWGYKAQKEGVEIALLECVILADWANSEAKVKKKQKISY